MYILRKLPVIATTLLALFASAGPAHADAALFTDSGATISGFDGLTFTVTNCRLDNTSTCGSSGVQMIATEATQNGLSGVNLEIVGSGTGAGADIFSGIGANSIGDLLFTLTVTSAGSRHLITEVINTLNGTISNSSGISSMNSNAIMNTTLFYAQKTTTGTSSVSRQYGPLAGQAFPQIVYMDINAQNSQGNAGLTLSLHNVNLFFAPAPEPASLALFGVALAGLTFVQRRRKSRRTAAAA